MKARKVEPALPVCTTEREFFPTPSTLRLPETSYTTGQGMAGGLVAISLRLAKGHMRILQVTGKDQAGLVYWHPHSFQWHCGLPVWL